MYNTTQKPSINLVSKTLIKKKVTYPTVTAVLGDDR